MSNMVVNTNVASLNSHRNMKKVGTAQFQAAARLSSGLRVNSAADDAAGLAISEKMRSQIRGLDMASKNSQDGISLIQTAEGGMQEIDNMIQRMRELIVQAANDTNDNGDLNSNDPYEAQGLQGDRRKIQDELDQLAEEIDSMAKRVEFNKKKLIDGTWAEGAATMARTGNTGLMTAIDTAFNAILTAADTGSAVGDALDNLLGIALSSGEISDIRSRLTNLLGNLQADATNYDKAILVPGMITAKLAQFRNELETEFTDRLSTGGVLQADWKDFLDELDNLGDVTAAPLSALKTAIDNAYTNHDPDDPDTGFAANGRAAGRSLWFQTGANAAQGLQVNIGSVMTSDLGIGRGAQGDDADGRELVYERTTPDNTNADGTTTAAARLLHNITLMDGAQITELLTLYDGALTTVTTERAKLGAIQNRLEYTIKSLDISSENLSASESRIRDADMGKEMMNLTKANVLQQAATSMLAQSNQNPQMVLQLLR